jgi:flavin-dependent dehydrogenase
LIEADVIIFGAGPAGATTALNLGPTRRVVIVERRPGMPSRTGESLPPAARRLFHDMGLLDDFLAEGHLPCYGDRARWGDDAAAERDFIRDPDGNGWHLDRARFDGWLRRIAVDRGSVLLIPAKLDVIQRDGVRWRLQLAAHDGPIALTATLVIDCKRRVVVYSANPRRTATSCLFYRRRPSRSADGT